MPRRPALPGVDRRQQILDAALHIFADLGYEGASTKEIASRADITQGLIYFYFPSKEELFIATVDHFAGMLQAEVTDIALHEPTELVEVVLRRIANRFITIMESSANMHLLRIITQEQSRSAVHPLCGGKPQQIRSLVITISGGILQFFDAAKADGRIRAIDTVMVAQIFANALVSLAIRRAVGDGSIAQFSRESLVDTVVDLFTHGVASGGTMPLS